MANSLKITSLVFLAWAVLASARIHAHGDRGWGSCGRTRKSACGGRGRGHHLHGGRHYNYHRRPRDTMDLVSLIFSSPIYYNSLLRQQDAQSARTTSSMDQRADGVVSSAAPFYTITESEDGQAIDLEIEVPGVSAKEINVEIENDRMVRVQGSRRLHESAGSVTQMRFDKVFQMDADADIENIQVTLSSGILRVSVPKKTRVVKSIPIAIHEDKKEREVVTTEETIDAEWVAVEEEDNENEIGSEDENEKLQIQQEDDFIITEEEDSWQ
jgi:HSP20 family molecular chaperone IbpA